MRELSAEILELMRLTSTDLPAGVEADLKKAMEAEEKGSAARTALDSILENISLTCCASTPICQDSGTPLFFVTYPEGYRPHDLRQQIRKAIANATHACYLRPNAVDPVSGINSGNNLGDAYFPSIYFEETDCGLLTIDLMLKGGGCENVGAQYSLPDVTLQAERDLEGVRKVVLDAVFQAQGMGCAPGYLGVAIGGDRGSGYFLAKKALLRKPGQANEEPVLTALEARITREANQLGIGPMGFGGKSTILGTSILKTYRLPASFFVTVSYMCWAYRHRRMVIDYNTVVYE
jgi:fumarate hydratase, class I